MINRLAAKQILCKVTHVADQPINDDMPAEIDFSKGRRGRFYNPDAITSLPVYLQADIHAYLADRAKARGINIEQLVNELLKKDIELIETAR